MELSTQKRKRLERLAKILKGGEASIVDQIASLDEELNAKIDALSEQLPPIDAVIARVKDGEPGPPGKDGAPGPRGEKGEPGKDGTTPVAGRDYPTVSQVDSALAQSLAKFKADHAELLAKAEARIQELRDGNDGRDGDLRDLSPQEMRDALELLVDDERLSVDAVAGVDALAERIAKRVVEEEIKDLDGNTVYVGNASSGGSAAWGGITGTLSDQTDLQDALDAKQDTLVSGTNIKTINGTSLLGSGNITISGGSGTKGIAEVDFGAVTQNNDIATVTVADASITATSYPSVSLYAFATTDHDSDDYMAEGLIPYVSSVTAGVGFDISVRAPSLTWGKYKVTYMY